MRYLDTAILIRPGTIALLLAGALLGGRTELYLAAIGIGLIEIGIVVYKRIRTGAGSLDYIAFLAMALAAFTQEYVAGAVIALMYTGGEALEAYASRRAEASLASLLARIPKTALVKRAGDGTEEVALAEVPTGATITVRG